MTKESRPVFQHLRLDALIKDSIDLILSQFILRDAGGE
jgi:hypothetical protein